MSEMQSNSMIRECFGANGNFLELEPGNENGDRRNSKEVEVRRRVKDSPPVLMVVKTVLHGGKEKKMDPEKKNRCPACESMHLLPHVMIAGAHLGEGQDNNVDQENVKGDSDEETSESDTLIGDVVLDPDDRNIEKEEPNDCSDTCARVYAAKMIELCDCPTDSQGETLWSFAKEPEQEIDDVFVTDQYCDCDVRSDGCR